MLTEEFLQRIRAGGRVFLEEKQEDAAGMSAEWTRSTEDN